MSKTEFCKKNIFWILLVIILLAVNIYFISTILDDRQTISQLKKDLSEKMNIIKLSLQKNEGNVYTDYIQLDNKTLYIPVLYRGKIITLVTTNYSNYRDYDMNKLYKFIETEYYESGNYGCAGPAVAVAGGDTLNPFSKEYTGISCMGDGSYINLDLPLNRENEYHSNSFSLGWGHYPDN